jgi:hypothetical protein
VATRERRQKKKARATELSKNVRAFLAIVNEGRFTFPHPYIPTTGRWGSTAVGSTYPVSFDASLPLHVDVRAAAVVVADYLIRAAARGELLPKRLGNPKGPLYFPSDNKFLKTQARNMSFDQRERLTHIQAKELEGAETAIETIRDAERELMRDGGYQCLRRCAFDGCRRVLFTTSDRRQYCDPVCRQRAHRVLSRKMPIHGRMTS